MKGLLDQIPILNKIFPTYLMTLALLPKGFYLYLAWQKIIRAILNAAGL